MLGVAPSRLLRANHLKSAAFPRLNEAWHLHRVEQARMGE